VRYREQELYFIGSRVAGALVVALVGVFAGACLKSFGIPKPVPAIEFGLIALALAVSIYYTPDYLHLTVAPAKPLNWAIKVRWRIIAAILVLGVFALSHRTGTLVLGGALAWLIVAGLLANKLSQPFAAFYFWGTDFALLAALILAGRLKGPLAVVLLAVSAHFSVVISTKLSVLWGMFAGISGCALLAAQFRSPHQDPASIAICACLVLASALGTALLVKRAQRHNDRNVSAAMRELTGFTGWSSDRIGHLWAVSNQELAKNWKMTGLDPNDAAGLARWYSDNSRLYLFAISAYNLEYKRIRSNLGVLRLARGACLDYGAGNGEIVLELARRGHPAAYYDVEGETMAFARQRAALENLPVQFLVSKETLASAARQQPFDTVFSLDVLEHLPDLPGELEFLASLLGSGGLLVFDVPAGATKSHPMHLNHRLDVGAHLIRKGLKDERGMLQRLPFRKEEKYFFRKP
jgi:SAM-dependent methyltransferase